MPPAELSPDPEDLRTDNERLRDENARLRAAVSAARPETPAVSTVSHTPVTGALVAADRLVHLMSEGGSLLKEREALQAENEVLESELQDLGIVDDGTILEEEEPGAKGTPDEPDAGAHDVPDLVMIHRLMPLLSEGDALRTEREGLRAERQELVRELKAIGERADQAALEAELEADRELEQRFLSAVQDASRERASLEAEIRKLREDNARLLRSRNNTPRKVESGSAKAVAGAGDVRDATVPSPLAGPPVVAMSPLMGQPSTTIPEEDTDAAYRQREAMASLLKKSQSTSPTTSRSSTAAGRTFSPQQKRLDLGRGQEEAMKDALHTLFRNFSR